MDAPAGTYFFIILSRGDIGGDLLLGLEGNQKSWIRGGSQNVFIPIYVSSSNYAFSMSLNK